ncbi:hypothetical protein ACRRS0_05065 [Agarivorans sp. QJM3NY_29]|uniref:hypothetical protein n=1 Tax=unclassified Agarivorans TaxID=2636026 RepID=UPI003D7CD98F
MAEYSGVNFEQRSKVATAMLTQGSKLSVRNVMQVTGGKAETETLVDANKKLATGSQSLYDYV